MENLITLEQVSFAYEEETILDKVDLVLPKNQITVVIGSSGAGKSTLLQLIAGFLQPTNGTITMMQAPITAPSWQRGVVFQDFALFPWLSVEKNITFGPRMRKSAKKEYQARLEELLLAIQLEKQRRQPVYTLSGGMQQRVALARVFLNNPELLLLDEAFSALDSFTRKNAYQLLLTLRQQFRNTVLLITHNLDEALYLGQRIVLLDAALKNPVIDNPFFADDRLETLQSPAFLHFKQELSAKLAR